MTQVTGPIFLTDGALAAGYELRIRPMTDDPASEDRHTTLPSTLDLTLDGNGSFVVDLEPSRAFDPPVVYEFRFTDPITFERTFAFRAVPDSTSPVRFDQLGDLDIALPDGSIEPAQLDYGGVEPTVGDAITYVSASRFGTAPIPSGGGGGSGQSTTRSTDLLDMPHTLRNQQGKSPVVRGVDGQEHYELEEPDRRFVDLEDTPDDLSEIPNRFLGVSNGGDEVEGRYIAEVDIPSAVARVSQVDSWAQTGNTDPIPASKLTNAPAGAPGAAPAPSSAVPQADGPTGLPGTTSTYARGDHRHPRFGITDAMIPAGITRDSEVEDWALAANPTEKIPSGKLPAQAIGAGSVGQAQLADGSVTPPKLDHNTPDKQQAFRSAIGAAAAGQGSAHVDTVWGGSFNARSDGQDLETGNPLSDINLAVQVGAASSSIRRINYSSDDQHLSIIFNNLNLNGPLVGHAFDINGRRYLVDQVFFKSTAQGRLELQWQASAGALVSGANSVSIYAPITDRNYLPGGGRPGDMLTWAANGTPVVEAIADILALQDHRPVRLLDRHSAGVTVGDVRHQAFLNFALFDPAQTAQAGGGGRIMWEATARTATGTAADITFTDAELVRSGAYSLAAVHDLAASGAGSTVGAKIASWEVMKSSLVAGTVDLYLGQNGSNRVGYFLHFDPSGVAGITSARFVPQVVLSVWAEPTK